MNINQTIQTMPSGGVRQGAGRKRGSKIAKTVEIALSLAKDGATPLEIILATMRDESQPQNIRLQCAAVAAPFVHPKMASVQPKVEKDNTVLLNSVLEKVKKMRLEKAEKEKNEPRPNMEQFIRHPTI